jgi:hypothetical protein
MAFDRLASYSNYGSTITLSAPGGDIPREIGGLIRQTQELITRETEATRQLISRETEATRQLVRETQEGTRQILQGITEILGRIDERVR